jgi:N-acylneuraminate cytidylyltransferase
MSIVALIPARSGSKRLPHKNVKMLNGYPLIVYTIQAAKDSGIFDEIVVSTDDFETGSIAVYHGAGYIERPAEYAIDTSPDIEWIKHALHMLKKVGREYDAFAILRPTSPFRTGETIKRAFDEWDGKHCMKAVEKVKQHPRKMWALWREDKTMMPYVEDDYESHLLPYQSLEEVYVQNASFEMRPIDKGYNFCQPFFTTGYEGFDINTIEDWILAEELIKRKMAVLPEVRA